MSVDRRLGASDWFPSRVGIALAAYEPEPQWLAEQIGSIAAQSHDDWFCVVTLDSPLAPLREHAVLAQYLVDPRFTWIENPNRLGLRKNFERAIQEAVHRGAEVVAFSDQDDIWLPEKVATSLEEIRRRGPRTAVYCDAWILVEGEDRTDTLHEHTIATTSELTIAERIVIPQVSGFCMMIDAELLRRFPSIPEIVLHHDYWYALVAATHGGVFRIAKPLARYRQHSANTTGISSIRRQHGWSIHASHSSIRERAILRAACAATVAEELPISPFARWLWKRQAGWAATLLAALVRRLFTERSIVAVVQRQLVGLTLLWPNAQPFVRRARQRLVGDRRSPVRNLALGGLAVVSAAASLGAGSVGGGLLLLGSAGAFGGWALTLLRLVQHQIPRTDVLSAAIGCTLGALLSATGVEHVPAFGAALVAPLLHVAYRVRWRVAAS